MNKPLRVVLIWIAVLFLLSSCSQPDPKILPTPTGAEADATDTYPLPAVPPAGNSTAYPNPHDIVPTPDVTYIEPAPGEDTGVVIGRLADHNTNEPLPFQTVYLGDIIPFVKGEGFSIGVQEKNSPHTMADKEGRFALGNVKPGTYVILVWTPLDSYIITQPGSTDPMQITVEAGKTIDIGEVKALDPLKVE